MPTKAMVATMVSTWCVRIASTHSRISIRRMPGVDALSRAMQPVLFWLTVCRSKLDKGRVRGPGL